MMKKMYFLLSLIVLFSVAGCVSPPEQAPDDINYPYYASPERKLKITEGVKKLVIGMPKAEALKIIGEPDEIVKTYNTLDAMDKGEPSGVSYVYLIQRKKKLGSIVERQEKLYKLRFNLNNLLTGIEREGIK